MKIIVSLLPAFGFVNSALAAPYNCSLFNGKTRTEISFNPQIDDFKYVENENALVRIGCMGIKGKSEKDVMLCFVTKYDDSESVNSQIHNMRQGFSQYFEINKGGTAGAIFDGSEMLGLSTWIDENMYYVSCRKQN